MLSLSVEKVFPIISKKKDLENRMKEIEKLETETDQIAFEKEILEIEKNVQTQVGAMFTDELPKLKPKEKLDYTLRNTDYASGKPITERRLSSNIKKGFEQNFKSFQAPVEK